MSTMDRLEFRAPWGRSLKLISAAASLLLLGVSLLPGAMSAPPPAAGWMAIIVPYSILLGAALFAVRGYRLQGDRLLIHRLLWSTPITLHGLRSARLDPLALRKSWRTWGNGGLFSYSGWYRNRTLGSYRMWVTDPNRAVVLELGGGNLVVSPDAPEKFLRALGFDPATDVENRIEVLP